MDVVVVGEAVSGDEVLPAVERGGVDVLLLDVTMPGRGFLDVLRELAERFPKVKTVVLSAHAEDEYAVRALRVGARGYITKERTSEELVAAVRLAYRGGRYVSATLAERLAFGLADRPDAEAHQALSNREFEVLKLFGQGRSVKEIAGDLSLSPKTISTYRSRILAKLELKTTADIIRYAMQHNIAQ